MRILVTGAGGQLGRDLLDALAGRVPPGGLRCALFGPAGPRRSVGDVVGTTHETLDVAERLAVLEAVSEVRPDVVIHAGAWTAVDACEGEPDRAYAVNALGTRNVAEAARRVGAHLVYVSTDYVFDGLAGRPYREWDDPCPLSVYGRSKLGGERECGPEATIVRTSWVCGAGGGNMVKTALRLAGGEGPLRFVEDQHGSPTFTADLAPAIVTLALERPAGVFHMTNQGETTWYDFVRAVLESAGHDPGRVQPISTADLDPARYPAPRPPFSVLDNAVVRASGWPSLPPWTEGLARLVRVLAQEGGRP